jgi:hypothetical protein
VRSIGYPLLFSKNAVDGDFLDYDAITGFGVASTGI